MIINGNAKECNSIFLCAVCRAFWKERKKELEEEIQPYLTFTPRHTQPITKSGMHGGVTKFELQILLDADPLNWPVEGGFPPPSNSTTRVSDEAYCCGLKGTQSHCRATILLQCTREAKRGRKRGHWRDITKMANAPWQHECNEFCFMYWF